MKRKTAAPTPECPLALLDRLAHLECELRAAEQRAIDAKAPDADADAAKIAELERRAEDLESERDALRDENENLRKVVDRVNEETSDALFDVLSRLQSLAASLDIACRTGPSAPDTIRSYAREISATLERADDAARDWLNSVNAAAHS